MQLEGHRQEALATPGAAPEASDAESRAPRASLAAQRRWLVTALLAVDSLALLAAAGLAYVIRFLAPLGLFRDVELSVGRYASMVFVMVLLWLGLFALTGLYAEQNLLGGTREYALVFNACTIGALLVIVTTFLVETLVVSRGLLLLAWLLTFLCVGVARFGFRRAVYALRRRGYLLRPTVIVGSNAEGAALASQLSQHRSSGMMLLGFVDDDRPAGTLVKGIWPVLGGYEVLDRLVARGAVEQLVVATGAVPRERLLSIVLGYGASARVDVLFSSGLFEVLTTGVQVQERASVPLIGLNKTRLGGFDRFLKTVLDYAVTLPALILLSPFLVAIAAAIKLDSPGAAIHRRRVLGLNGNEFDAYKFRTMRSGWETTIEDEGVRQQFIAGVKPRDDPRVTRIGRFLRSYSLDELPQLANVLKREMSLVGPRMITREEAGFYQQWLMNLLTVRPGITGLWQVSGRAETSYEDKVRLDMTYIRNYSIWLDLQILLQTIPVILRSRGAF